MILKKTQKIIGVSILVLIVAFIIKDWSSNNEDILWAHFTGLTGWLLVLIQDFYIDKLENEKVESVSKQCGCDNCSCN